VDQVPPYCINVTKHLRSRQEKTSTKESCWTAPIKLFLIKQKPQNLGTLSPIEQAWENITMSTLYLVRHGQASAGTDDYDRLSELGKTQAELLGQWWQKQGFSADFTSHGSLQRQRDTVAKTSKFQRRIHRSRRAERVRP